MCPRNTKQGQQRVDWYDDDSYNNIRGLVMSPGNCGLQRATLQGYEICAKRIFLPVCFCKYIWVLSVDNYDEHANSLFIIFFIMFENLHHRHETIKAGTSVKASFTSYHLSC